MTEQELIFEFEQVTGLSRDRHFMLRYEAGCEWVEHRFKFKPILRKKWLRSNVFWSWWNIQWLIVIDKFLLADTTNSQYAQLLAFNIKSFPAGPLVQKIYKQPLHAK